MDPGESRRRIHRGYLKTALYLDEDVAARLAPRLTANGHPTRTTQSEGRRGSKDAIQLLYAARHGWAFVAINRGHFLNLHVAWLEWTREWGVERRHPGILIIPPMGGEVTVDRVVREITGFLNHQPPLANECYEWRPERNAWWRYPPPNDDGPERAVVSDITSPPAASPVW